MMTYEDWEALSNLVAASHRGFEPVEVGIDGSGMVYLGVQRGRAIFRLRSFSDWERLKDDDLDAVCNPWERTCA